MQLPFIDDGRWLAFTVERPATSDGHVLDIGWLDLAAWHPLEFAQGNDAQGGRTAAFIRHGRALCEGF